jgi:nicotinamidase-related amidase
VRLPADATLIVVGARNGADTESTGETIRALIEAWRREELPAIDVRGDEHRPEDGPFASGPLEAQLEDLGATTLVLCGEAAVVAVAARDAAALGFRVFIVGEACWTRGEASAPSTLARAPGAIVDVATTLAASAVARARQRGSARRARPPRRDPH